MSILRNKVIDEHIEAYYPNAKIADYREKDSGLVFYSARELQNVDADWFPLCCYKDIETGETIYGGREKIVHTYTEGETGAGKTTRFVMQAIRALSSMKNKPSLLIVDNGGGITEVLYPCVKDVYDFKILNCDNPQRSDTYNPLCEMVNECEKTRCISNETSNQIKKIAEIMQPIESTQEPIWDQGARSYTNGLILDKFEDLIKGKIPKECVTLYNIIQNHYWVRKQLPDTYGMCDLFTIPHYKEKGIQALSTQKMISVTNNAERTKNSYFGVIENHFDIFAQPTMYSLCSNSTINISDFINKPTIIVIQTGGSQIGENLISLLLNDIYTQVVKLGKEKKMTRNIHCFLDEFANCNIADGSEFIKMLTTSRKYGLFWHMILQCDAQLDRKFDPYIGKIIRANATEIFMGSHDYETEVRFAKSCGRKTIESLASAVSQHDPQLDVVDLMTAEKLNLMEEGYVYVKSNRHPLLRTYIEAFYNCEDFPSEISAEEIYPKNDFDYTKTAFFPDDLDKKTWRKNKDGHILIYPPKYETFEELKEKVTDFRSLLEPPDGEPEVNVFMDDNTVDRTGLMYTAIKDHLKNQTEEQVCDVISKLTCVPEFLKNVIHETFSNELIEDYEQPENTNILKFEIIEEFIKNNDFKKKSEWNKKIQKEYDSIQKREMFPNMITKAFEDALREIQEELTLSDLQEIKRIILGSNSDNKENCENTDIVDEENSWYEELKEYLETQEEDTVYQSIGRLTCIPDCLKAVIDEIFLGKVIDRDDIPDNTNFLKFEIIETFFINHHFERKIEWNREMKKEYDDLRESYIFPKRIMDAFGCALREIRDELTLANIKEIRKILTSSNDEFHHETDPVVMDDDIFNQENPLYDDLREHLTGQTEEFVYHTISDLTCIPVSLRNVIDEMFLGKSIDHDEMPNNVNVLKYEIIEEFIKNNDFDEKADWERKMKEEFEHLKESNIFSEFILSAFDDALYELVHHLSLSNIKEIKRILEEQSH